MNAQHVAVQPSSGVGTPAVVRLEGAQDLSQMVRPVGSRSSPPNLSLPLRLHGLRPGLDGSPPASRIAPLKSCNGGLLTVSAKNDELLAGSKAGQESNCYR